MKSSRAGGSDLFMFRSPKQHVASYRACAVTCQSVSRCSASNEQQQIFDPTQQPETVIHKASCETRFRRSGPTIGSALGGRAIRSRKIIQLPNERANIAEKMGH